MAQLQCPPPRTPPTQTPWHPAVLCCVQDDLKAAAARMPRCQELSRMAAEDSPEHDPGAEYEVEEEAAEEDEYE